MRNEIMLSVTLAENRRMVHCIAGVGGIERAGRIL
jgi:hypothetical protein